MKLISQKLDNRFIFK